MKHTICEDDIERISIKNLPYHTDSACKLIESYCKQLLTVSRDFNNSNECGMLLDSFDLSKYRLIKGTETNVNLDVNLNYYITINSDEYSHRFIFIHNHPNNSSFSFRDFKSFITNDGLYMLIVVQNNGISNILMKTSNIDIEPKLDKNMNFKSIIEYLRNFGIIYYRRYNNV